jgi:thioredoxin-like negative regulator of GroEL
MTSALVSLALLVGGHGPAGIKWERSFESATKKARAANKPIMIDFWAEWCGWCHRLDQTTYVDPRVVKLAEDFVTVKVDTEGGSKDAAVAARYDVTTLPTIAFVSPTGRPLMRLNGFQGPGQFPVTLAAAREVAGRVMAWEAALERDARDAVALMKLGVHLFEQESYAESRDLLARAARHDHERPAPERKKTRMLLGIIQNYDRKYAEAEALLKEALAMRPSGEEEPKILYVLGRTYLAWGRAGEARAAMEQILEAHPQSPIAAKARDTLAALERKKR